MRIQSEKAEDDRFKELVKEHNRIGKEIRKIQKEVQSKFLIEELLDDDQLISEQKRYGMQIEEMGKQLKLAEKKKSKGTNNVENVQSDYAPYNLTSSIMQKGQKKKSHQQYIQEVRVLVGNEYTVLGTYVGATQRIRFRHNVCGCEYEVMPNAFTSKGNRCPQCAKLLKGRQTKSHDTFIQEVYELVKEEYTVLGKYKGSKLKVLIKHNTCGYEWEVAPHLFLSGTRCPKCAEKKKKEELGKTHEEYVAEVKKIHGEEYAILGEYSNGQTKILVQHNECGYQWQVRAQNLLGHTRCPKCYGVFKKTQEEFEEQVRERVGNEYLVIGEYINSRTKVEIMHQKCRHIYEVLPNAFLQGKRCPACRTDVLDTQ